MTNSKEISIICGKKKEDLIRIAMRPTQLSFISRNRIAEESTVRLLLLNNFPSIFPARTSRRFHDFLIRYLFSLNSKTHLRTFSSTIVNNLLILNLHLSPLTLQRSRSRSRRRRRSRSRWGRRWRRLLPGRLTRRHWWEASLRREKTWEERESEEIGLLWRRKGRGGVWSVGEKKGFKNKRGERKWEGAGKVFPKYLEVWIIGGKHQSFFFKKNIN